MSINLKKEEDKIIKFINEVLQKEKFKKVVLGLSGGIDSTTSLYLLKKTIPKKNIISVHSYYFEPENLETITKDLPKENVFNISIKEVVDRLFYLGRWQAERKRSHDSSKVDRVRFGNIAARVRMIILYDFAKKHNALVCGTENKSEHLLGYYTRFGDEASDFEPIRHLYKTQVFELAKYLKVPKNFIEKKPTAGLWQNQTDEGEFGFSYKEADQVLYLHFEQKRTIEQIKKEGFKNAEKIINFALKNSYKHQTPYII